MFSPSSICLLFYLLVFELGSFKGPISTIVGNLVQLVFCNLRRLLDLGGGLQSAERHSSLLLLLIIDCFSATKTQSVQPHASPDKSPALCSVSSFF